MVPKYIFVKADGHTYSICNAAGLVHAMNLVRGQMRSEANKTAPDGNSLLLNLEIVLQAAEKYKDILCGIDEPEL